MITRDGAEREQQRAVQPAVDTFRDAGGITLLADLPGVPRDQLELKIEGETLLIEGRVLPPTPEGLEAVYAEVRAPRYRRSFTWPSNCSATIWRCWEIQPPASPPRWRR